MKIIKLTEEGDIVDVMRYSETCKDCTEQWLISIIKERVKKGIKPKLKTAIYPGSKEGETIIVHINNNK